MKWIRFTVIALLAFGCTRPAATSSTLTLATTTSTRDTGLLDMLVPAFESETGITVKVVAVGSGQALELGRRGDADVLLTHAPEAEQQFMGEGCGDRRVHVMHNDFVIVGPASDPAGIRDCATAAEAFAAIARTEAPFISRADESGTHMKEKTIWTSSAVNPQGDWYVRSGSGMAATLRMATEEQAYALTDRGTFLAMRDELDLTILFEDDSQLVNPYAVIVVNSDKHPTVNHGAADRFADFLLSPQAQTIITEFGVEQFSQPLFFAADQPTDNP